MFSETNTINGLYDRYAVVEFTAKAFDEECIRGIYRDVLLKSDRVGKGMVCEAGFTEPHLCIHTSGKLKGKTTLTIARILDNSRVPNEDSNICNEEFFSIRRNNSIQFTAPIQHLEEYQIKMILPFFPVANTDANGIAKYMKTVVNYRRANGDRKTNKGYLTLAVDCNGNLFTIRLYNRKLFIYPYIDTKCKVLSAWEWKGKK